MWRLNHRRLCSTISNLIQNAQPSDEIVKVKGWVRRCRNQKKAIFCHVGDGLSPALIQVILDKEKFEDMSNFGVGSAVEIEGRIVSSPAPQQRIELLASTLQSHCPDPNNPFHCKVKPKPMVLRRMQHLRVKSSSFASLLRIRSSVKQCLHNYLQGQEFVQIDTPIITSNDCEGAGEYFEVNGQIRGECEGIDAESEDKEDVDDETLKNVHYFGQPSHLTVSAQLHLEALASGMTKVYSFNPTFRAEKSRSRHHLAEFYMLEAEMAFCNELEQIMQLAEQLIRKAATHVRDAHETELSQFAENRVQSCISGAPFVRVSFDQATQILAQHKVYSKREKGLNREQELTLLKHCNNVPVFVTHYPANTKPFYMKRSHDDTVECFDLLLPEVGEVCGGSLRENDFDALQHRIQNDGLSPSLDWYLELRRHGHPTLGGFGIGFERFIQCLLGVVNVRDTLPFPRWFKRCSF